MARREDRTTVVIGTILEEEELLSLADVCRASQLPAESIIELVQEGIIEPIGKEPESWGFRGVSLRRIRCARRLEEDLGVNTAGVALALDLLDELRRLRARLRRFET